MNRPTTKGYTPVVIELACNAMMTAARAKAGCGSAELLVLQHPACWPAVGAEDRPMAEVARVWSSLTVVLMGLMSRCANCRCIPPEGQRRAHRSGGYRFRSVDCLYGLHPQLEEGAAPIGAWVY